MLRNLSWRLGDLVEQCEAQPCRHNNFDYLCLITWLQEQATCQLCKSDVHEVRYELGEDGRQGKVYKLTGRSGPETSSDRAEERLSRSVYEDETIQRQRFVYRLDLYSLHVGPNRRQPAASRYRELSPQLFMTDPELVSRARMWPRRELRVFKILYADGDSLDDHDPIRRRRAGNAEFLLKYTVAILKTMDFFLIPKSQSSVEQLYLPWILFGQTLPN
ncbi:uncharacterized protein LY89DRAFT_722692 [Mollisia scopiformis]|uniref:RING-type E3 ubiquitin transferase n=1 Tax=Mollisia scopiformis TaxID=149040 RepID=A0A194WUC9_MOLSC|nr:uncharacterized protein LY89DRAFT_722692 [Mollisia scopiformis]KUJ11568.1 hypothetical protein LY89DRAFT_722692 [Mollisia scopiformis]